MSNTAARPERGQRGEPCAEGGSAARERTAVREARVRARGFEPLRAEAHQDLNLARLPVPPRPRARFRIDPDGHKLCMADPEQRERESQEEDKTKYQQRREEERADVERVAEDVQDAPLTERDE